MINFEKMKNLEPTRRLELAKENGFFIGNPDLSDEEFKSLDDYYHYCFDRKVPYIHIGDNMDGSGWILVTLPSNIDVDEYFLNDCSKVFSNYGGTLVREGVGGFSSLLHLDVVSSAVTKILMFWMARVKLASLDISNPYIN